MRFYKEWVSVINNGMVNIIAKKLQSECATPIQHATCVVCLVTGITPAYCVICSVCYTCFVNTAIYCVTPVPITGITPVYCVICSICYSSLINTTYLLCYPCAGYRCTAPVYCIKCSVCYTCLVNTATCCVTPVLVKGVLRLVYYVQFVTPV